jgi:hypothetical protein
MGTAFAKDTIMRSTICAVCGEQALTWDRVDGHDFTDCGHCGSIALVTETIDQIDRGQFVRDYDTNYWQDEQIAAKDRAWGSSLARAAEAIYLTRRPVHRFIDIGSGDGSLLESLSTHLPNFSGQLFGVEMFPPAKRTSHPGYVHASLADMNGSYDTGVCIEVIEHLTPKMLDGLLAALSLKSEPDALFIFNTGLGDFVRFEDRSYIDPVRRGHIVSYGWAAIEAIFARHHFRVSKIGNRNWAFVAEKSPTTSFDIHDRVWQPVPKNIAILQDPTTGSLMQLLARESLRVDA